MYKINDQREKMPYCWHFKGKGGLEILDLKEGVKNRPSSSNNNAAKNSCRRKYVTARLGFPLFHQ